MHVEERVILIPLYLRYYSEGDHRWQHANTTWKKTYNSIYLTGNLSLRGAAAKTVILYSTRPAPSRNALN
jgi:hypothetical protein